MSHFQSNKATVKEIFIYPIKSLAGIKLEKCLVTKTGLVHPDNPLLADRKWMLIETSTGRFVTQRKISRMALIQPSLLNDCIELTAPGQPKLCIPLKPTKNKINCRVWGLDVPGYIYDQNVEDWLSAFLDIKGLNIVQFGSDLMNEARELKKIDPNYYPDSSDKTLYSDNSPFMLISDESLIDLNSRLVNKVKIQNFRPNFLIQNTSGPYSEDEFGDFKIGNLEFKKIKHCTRCLLTTVDPDIGERSTDKEPLNTLKK